MSSKRILSVEQALWVSKLIVTSLVFISMSLLVGGIIFFGVYYEKQWWLVIISSILSMVVSALYYYFALTRWRIWAYNNVVSIYELEHSKDSLPSVFISESWPLALSKREKQKLKDIEQKLSEPPVFDDDPAVPERTEIHYSRIKIYLRLSFHTLLVSTYAILSFNIPGDFQGPWTVLGIFLLGIAGFLGFRLIKKLQNIVPILIVSNDGVESEIGFYKWNDISDENVNYRWDGGRSNPFYEFNYNSPNGSYSTILKLYNYSPLGLQHLLYIYRGRYCNKSGISFDIKKGGGMQKIAANAGAFVIKDR